MASFDRCLKTLAHRFAFVRDDARIQRDAALPRARCSRFRVITRMCPTDFCQPLTLPLLHPRSWFPTLLDPPSKGWGDRRVRRFTTRWTRFGGSYGDEEGCWPSRVVVVHFVHPNPARCLAPLTTSPLAARRPPEHASAFPGRLAWSPKDLDRFHRPSVKGAICRDPRRLPSSRHPFSFRAAPRVCLPTTHGLSTPC